MQKDEQLKVESEMLSDISQLRDERGQPGAPGNNALVKSYVILTDGPLKTGTTPFVDAVASDPLISQGNGFNCTQVDTPCRTRKVGVVRMVQDSQYLGMPIPLYVNVVVQANGKRDTADGQSLKIAPEGQLDIERYSASRFG